MWWNPRFLPQLNYVRRVFEWGGGSGEDPLAVSGGTIVWSQLSVLISLHCPPFSLFWKHRYVLFFIPLSNPAYRLLCREKQSEGMYCCLFCYILPTKTAILFFSKVFLLSCATSCIHLCTKQEARNECVWYAIKSLCHILLFAELMNTCRSLVLLPFLYILKKNMFTSSLLSYCY